MSEEIIKKYNKTFKKLIDILDNTIPNNNLIDKIKQKYRVALVSDRDLIIEKTGDSIFLYKEYIVNDKWDELLNLKWESKTENPQFIQIISILRNLWIEYDNEEKKIICKYIKILLSEYCKYIQNL
jgi:hypothetical protein